MLKKLYTIFKEIKSGKRYSLGNYYKMFSDSKVDDQYNYQNY